MYASVKSKGRSIGYIIELYIGKLGKRLFLLFTWLFSILVVAAFADIVAGTFNGFVAATGEKIAANGAVATTSLLFIVFAVALGFFLKYSKCGKAVNTAVAVVLLVVASGIGTCLPGICSAACMADLRICIRYHCLRYPCMGPAPAA